MAHLQPAPASLPSRGRPTLPGLSHIGFSVVGTRATGQWTGCGFFIDMACWTMSAGILLPGRSGHSPLCVPSRCHTLCSWLCPVSSNSGWDHSPHAARASGHTRRSRKLREPPLQLPKTESVGHEEFVKNYSLISYVDLLTWACLSAKGMVPCDEYFTRVNYSLYEPKFKPASCDHPIGLVQCHR